MSYPISPPTSPILPTRVQVGPLVTPEHSNLSLARYSLTAHDSPRTHSVFQIAHNSLSALREIPSSNPPPIPAILPSIPGTSNPKPATLKRSFHDMSRGEETPPSKMTPKKLNAIAESNSSRKNLLLSAASFFNQCQYEQSIDAIRQAFQCCPEEAFTVILLSKFQALINRPSTLMHAEAMLYRNPRDSYGLFLQALCNIKPTKYADSLRAFELILADNPDDELVLLLKRDINQICSREQRSASLDKRPQSSIDFLLNKDS